MSKNHELESFVPPPDYEYSTVPLQLEQVEGSSQKQKVLVKYLVTTKNRVKEFESEFWMDPSTTLEAACAIANKNFVRDLNSSDKNSARRLVRTLGKWLDLESTQGACGVVFIKPLILAGDLQQTIGSTIQDDNYLYLSNSVDCFHVKKRYEDIGAVLGVISVAIFILIFLGILYH
ncbi:CIC11C00000004436 [Sungouiella intermedia]|uniref:CIC11C00000004436 n=1 Tax=Sungouiella intermedia TaxID=45354 RepID=A0A1L0DF12_9ASCO|nr:CIC11C00000004436 [[Candida] intermedia]